MSVINSNNGTTALVSKDIFLADGLEISAVITNGGKSILGYGDHEWSLVGNRGYLLYNSGSGILGLSWNNGSLGKNINCGTVVSGATYKMKIIPTGFEVYKNNILQCTVEPGAGNLVNNKPIFLEGNSSSATGFDNIYVRGVYTPPTAPTTPTIGTAVSDNAQATITFTPGSSGGSPITGYTVTSSPGGITATGSSSPITVTGLTNGIEYTFTVTATNAVGTSPTSSMSNAVTPSVPTVPDQVTGVEVTGVNKQALVSWNIPDNGGAPISDYLIEYKLSSSDFWSVSVDGVSTNTKAIVKGLINGLAYDFRVSAVNSGGGRYCFI